MTAKSKIIVHETRAENKTGEHHFVSNKELVKEELIREIQKKAYELYESRGAVPGRELDDWLEAERLITAEEPR